VNNIVNKEKFQDAMKNIGSIKRNVNVIKGIKSDRMSVSMSKNLADKSIFLKDNVSRFQSRQ
jgi:hypothetical protein